MPYPETSGLPERYPLKEAAEVYCGRLNDALALWQQWDAEPTEEKLREAQARSVNLIQESFQGALGFNLEVTIVNPPDAHISRNWEVLQDSPSLFEATEPRSLNERGVEFINIYTEQWLVVTGHNVTIKPVLPQ